MRAGNASSPVCRVLRHDRAQQTCCRDAMQHRAGGYWALLAALNSQRAPLARACGCGRRAEQSACAAGRGMWMRAPRATVHDGAFCVQCARRVRGIGRRLCLLFALERWVVQEEEVEGFY